MPLRDDQRAILELLLERGQGYDDLARLLELDRDEVRLRAHSALAGLAGESLDRDVALADYLLGQADPLDRVEVVRHLRADPGDLALASELSRRLGELLPGARSPKLPSAGRRGGLMARALRSAEPAPGGASHPSGRRGRLAAALLSAAALATVGVLAAGGAFEGGAEGERSGASAPSPASSGSAEPAPDPVALELVGVEDAPGAGALTFAADGERPYIELELRGLEPPGAGEAYVLWFLLDGGSGFPLPSVLAVDGEGDLETRIAITLETVAIAQQARRIVIARNDERRLAGQIESAVRAERPELRYPGGTVLEARVPAAAGLEGG